MLLSAPSPAPSLEGVYRANFDFVWRTLRALGVNDSALDDAAQDVFVVVHRRLAAFEGRASLKTWLYEIARRVALRYRSEAVNDAARTFELPDLWASDDLDAAVDRAMATEILRAFLATLDEDRRCAFVLAEFWDMPGREIAEALGVNINTVYARIRSARTNLDRLAQRLHAEDSGALLRAMRTFRPSAPTRERAWAGVLASAGSPAVLPATEAIAEGVAATGFLKLAAAGIATVVLGTAVMTMGGVGSSSTATAPTSIRASVTSRRETSPSVPPAPAPAPAPAVLPAQPTAPKPDIAPPVEHDRTRLRPEPPPRTPSTLTDETQSLRAIRTAVRAAAGGPAHREIEAYRRRFPRGALHREVDALEVELACRISSPDAPDSLRRFRAQQPDPHLLERLERICDHE